MLISEAASRAGVSRDTVRLYTRLGLVTSRTRQAGSRVYADYDQDAVELIKNIKIAQSIGFSLAELVPIAAVYVTGQLDAGKQQALLKDKLAELEERKRKLEQMSEFLRSKLNDLQAGDLPETSAQVPARCQCHRDVAERPVHSILGKLDLPDSSDDHRRVLAVLVYLSSAGS